VPKRIKLSDRPTPGRQHTVPKFERTYTDIAADDFYNPSTVVHQPKQRSVSDSRISIQHTPTHEPANVPPHQLLPKNIAPLLNPRPSSPSPPSQNAVQRALDVAQNARKQSQNDPVPRDISPFRKQSPYRPPGMAGLPKYLGPEPEPRTIFPADALFSYDQHD
jgi:hypothetical protein